MYFFNFEKIVMDRPYHLFLTYNQTFSSVYCFIRSRKVFFCLPLIGFKSHSEELGKNIKNDKKNLRRWHCIHVKNELRTTKK